MAVRSGALAAARAAVRHAPDSRDARGTRRLRYGIAALEITVALPAVWGGVMLMSDAWDLPHAWLVHSPFHTWVLPGLALLVFVGAGEALAAAGALRWRSLLVRPLSILAGVGLVAWILVQITWLRMVHPVMQPLIALFGAAITALAVRLPRRA